MLLVVLGVAFVYCGGSNVPAVLRNNKQLLGGVVVGLFLCSFFAMRLEGLPKNDSDKDKDCPGVKKNFIQLIDTVKDKGLRADFFGNLSDVIWCLEHGRGKQCRGSVEEYFKQLINEVGDKRLRAQLNKEYPAWAVCHSKG